MDLERGRSFWVLGCVLLLFCCPNFARGNVVLEVHHKFAGREKSLAALKAHDDRRHGRNLAAVDIPLGGNGSPTDVAIYYTKIKIGTPSEEYYLQVDTGSDLMWVNCFGCPNCPTTSDIGIDLKLYNPKDSSTATTVSCEQDFCAAAVGPTGCTVGSRCEYSIAYGDGSTSTGFFIKDNVELNRASGNLQTTPMNGSVVFGCAAKQGGGLGKDDLASDGILGFGQDNSSMLSQLAAAGKFKKMFAHCLDSNKGGGIFAIGQLVQPQLKSAPLVPNRPHYNVMLKALEVGGDAVELPTNLFDTDTGRAMVIDSGTTLAYLEDDLFKPIMNKILAAQPNLPVHTVEEQFNCFEFGKSVDKGFPDVTFRFENSLSMTVYPHDYLFPYKDMWCLGWQNSGVPSSNGKSLNLLGDIVLANKLIFYNLENQTIGWTQYNCSAGVKMKDQESGAEYTIGSHDLSPACSLNAGWTSILLSVLLIPMAVVLSE
ncbi:Nepenthesin [Bertholletia excelsa]